MRLLALFSLCATLVSCVAGPGVSLLPSLTATPDPTASAPPASSASPVVPSPDPYALIQNPSFADGTTNWWRTSASGGATLNVETSDGDGDIVHISSPTGGKANILQYFPISSVINRQITITGQAKGSGAFYISLVSNTTNLPNALPPAQIIQNLTSSTWQGFSATFNLPFSTYPLNSLGFIIGISGNSDIKLDQFNLTVSGSAPSFTILKQAAPVVKIPDSADMVFESLYGGLSSKEVFVMKDDGTQITQVSFNTSNGILHPAMSPDHTMVAFEHFLGPSSGSNPNGGVPLVVTVLDFVNGLEWQLTPSWIVAGLGGIDWSPDSRYLYFGAQTDFGPCPPLTALD